MKLRPHHIPMWLLGVIASVILWPSPVLNTLSLRKREKRKLDCQLSGLADQLRIYHREHGRYPDNNEGLSKLQGFDATFPVNFPFDRKYGWHRWDQKHSLSQFRKQHGGRAPTNEAELIDAAPGVILAGGSNELPNALIMLDGSNNMYVATAGFIVSPGLLPYLYENRSGFVSNEFLRSIADDDHRNDYSRMVDTGVYVYSVEGWYLLQDTRRAWWRDRGPKIAIVSVSILCFASVLLIRPRNFWSWFWTFLIGALPMAVSMAGVSCYFSSLNFFKRHPHAVAKQIELIEQYHTNGVINDQTYRRLMDATATTSSSR